VQKKPTSIEGQHFNAVCWEQIERMELTPCSKVLPEKLTGPQLLKKFPAFYGTRRLINAFTKACHLSVS
jgi:hypothetical protein